MKKKRLKIAIFHLAFFYSGGGEKLVLEEVKGLKKLGHKVVCWTPVMEKNSCYPDKIESYDIRLIFPLWEKIFPGQASVAILLTCIFFPLIAKRFKDYDVVLGAGQPGFWFGWWVKKITGVNYVIYANQPTRILYPRKIDQQTGMWLKKRSRLPQVLNLIKPLVNWADKISIKAGSEMLANGEYISRILTRVYGRGNIVCPSGAYPTKKLAENRWQGLIKFNGFQIKKPYILITNRHFPQKKFEYMIETLPQIIKKAGKVNLVITGNRTEYTDFLEDLVIKLNLTERVLFTNLVKESEMELLYQQAAVYVYTSPEEDFGMGVIEAQAAGVPVVAWNKGGPATTIIDGQTGYLVRADDKSEWVGKIVDLIKNKQKNKLMGKQAVKQIQKHFTWGKHLKILETALKKAAK